MADRTVFISHRHGDRAIADVLRRFLDRIGAGHIRVFQSTYEGSGPQIGGSLTEELGAALRGAEVVLLIYTVADNNWSYCMWEAGVAFDPQTPDTRIVVMQCGDAAPAPLNDRVRVRIHDLVSLGQFVSGVMTGPDFFPNHNEPLTGFSAEHEEVRRATEELHSALGEVAPFEPDEEWPAWPAVRLRLDRAIADRILEHGEGRAAQDELLLQHCEVISWDKYAPDIFGWPDFQKDSSLARVVSRCVTDGVVDPWLRSLLDQLVKAVAWEFPDCAWAPLRSQRTNRSHVPILVHVKRSARLRSFEFEVIFPETKSPNGAE